MREEPQIGAPLLRTRASRRSVAVAASAIAVIWLLVWFHSTAQSIELIWRRSETFAHGYVIVPIVLYLVWRDRHRLASVPIVPTAAAFPLLAAAGFAWLVAQAASVVGGAQFMFAAMIPLALWALLGTAMLRALAFPMVFLFFAVPFGEFAVPKLMDWTADFTVVALTATGVPVFREGNSFIIPSGRWSVVEACSGVRYLIASLVVGALYAYLTYRSWRRRAVFVVAAIAVPLVANWVRAYMIVMIGHLSNNRLAVGVDHVIYGWVFFGVVMVLLFGVASIWRDGDAADVPHGASSPGVAPAPPPRRIALFAAAVVAVTFPWVPLFARLDAANEVHSVRLGAIAPAAGWAGTDADAVGFRPDFANPVAESTQYFAKGDRQVGVFVGYYAGQTQGRELVSHHNTLATTANRQWRELRQPRVDAEVGGVPLPVRTALLIGETGRLVAWQWYWVDGRLTSSDIVAKLLLAAARLAGRGDASAVVVVFAPAGGQGAADAHAVLGEFVVGMGASISRMLHDAEAR